MFRKALANDPEFLLMDEPFGALDAQTRLIMQEILLKVWEDTGKTILFVTHDVNEAVFLADKVYVMTARPGKLKYIQDIDFERPRHPDINTLLKSYPLFVYRVDEHYSEMTDVYIKKISCTQAKLLNSAVFPRSRRQFLMASALVLFLLLSSGRNSIKTFCSLWFRVRSLFMYSHLLSSQKVRPNGQMPRSS